MKPTTEFTIACGPGTWWKLKIFVWPTLKTLRAQRDGDEVIDENIAVAFFRPILLEKARKTGILGEMHFYRGELRPKIVAHEASHALVNYGKVVRLDLDTRSGDEQFAESIEHVVDGTLWSFRKLLKKKARRKK